MNIPKIKLTAVTLLAAPVIAVSMLSGGVPATALADDDTAALYKAKCAMCHSPKAEKAFNPELTDEELVKAILEGKKGEKPPFMPAYKDKGIDEAKAQALVKHMRELRTPPAE